LDNQHISLAHGNGGRFMRAIINDIFARHLANPYLDVNVDAASLAINLQGQNLVFTTDGFTVQPLEFPGGNIGSLAVHGTTNDLAVVGAKPLFLSLSAIIEEGLDIVQLERIVKSLGDAARAINVHVVAGDTKVVRRGECGGLYLTMSGIGIGCKHPLGLGCIQNGDSVVINGTAGDHGIAVMLAREEFGLSGDVVSDCASVLPFTQTALQFSELHFMRDPTRGGVATVGYEINHVTGLGVILHETAIPIHPATQTVCEILGYDPLYLACEGRVMAIIAAEQAPKLVECWRQLPNGQHAAIIGEITRSTHRVLLRTELGGMRVLDALEDDPLPRIC
jgi:hydrogenase expression/formation protein HypE